MTFRFLDTRMGGRPARVFARLKTAHRQLFLIPFRDDLVSFNMP